MPKVPMVATRDFTYSTRRLKANDDFEARNPMDARILSQVRRVAEVAEPKAADEPRPPIPTVEEVLEGKVIEPKAKAAPKPKTTRRKRKAKARK